MKHFARKPLSVAVSAALTSSVLIAAATPVRAQEQSSSALEEIVVTAQKREENLQDVPISVQVLGNQQLEDLNLNNFADYIQFLPTVSYTSERPGVSLLYMRGISSGGDGVHSGSLPSVGVYLDEQPVTTINRVLDIHIYDIARIETLAGPQGTYFGASSETGTMRIITNKPKIGEFEAAVDLSANSVTKGGSGYTLEGFANIPVGDNAAIRLVGWYDDAPGYIDNVLTTMTFRGVGITKDNSALVKKDFNDSQTAGMRALLKVDLNENWTVTPGFMMQKQDTNGVYTHDPEDLGDLQAGRFYDEYYDFSWYQASLTLEGKIGDLDLVYAGAYFDLDSDSLDDYSHYAQYLDNYYYYLGEYYGYEGCYHHDRNGNCTDPSQYITSDETFSKYSHELRLQSGQDQRARWMVGGFVQRQEHHFDLRWETPDLDTINSVIEGGHVAWQTKQDRIDKDLAFFGEVSFDVNDTVTLVGGYRWYQFDNSLSGFNGWLGRCLDANDQPQYPCYSEAPNVDDVTKDNGDLVKLSVNFNVGDNKLLYLTYSEGFRPGGVNRATVAGELEPKYDPDFVDNYEFGWKTMWLGNRLRFNGAAYHLEWDNFQFAFLDYAISPLTIIRNIGKAKSNGTEFDLVFAASDALTLSMSASYNDATLEQPYFGGGTDVLAPTGQDLPFVPKLKYTAIGRYEFGGIRLPAYVQAAVAYTGKEWSNLETDLRENQPAYTIVNLAAGIHGDVWALDLFVDNATDERAQIIRYGGTYWDPYDDITQDSTILVNRPRSYGLRFGYKF